MELIDELRAALIAEVQRQTDGNWPLDVNDDDSYPMLVDAGIDFTELAQAALTTLQAREATLIRVLRDARRLLYAQVMLAGPHQQCGSMIDQIDEALATSELVERS